MQERGHGIGEPQDAPPSGAAGAAKAKPDGNAKLGAGCLVALVLAFGGCGAWVFGSGGQDSSGSTSATSGPAPAPASSAGSPAQALDDLDGDTVPVGRYQAAIDALAPKCTQDGPTVAGLGDAGYKDLVQHGVRDETRLSVLEHLSQSIPSSLGKTDCVGMLSAYLVLREQ